MEIKFDNYLSAIEFCSFDKNLLLAISSQINSLMVNCGLICDYLHALYYWNNYITCRQKITSRILFRKNIILIYLIKVYDLSKRKLVETVRNTSKCSFVSLCCVETHPNIVTSSANGQLDMYAYKEERLTLINSMSLEKLHGEHTVKRTYPGLQFFFIQKNLWGFCIGNKLWNIQYRNYLAYF